ncbi:PREDICTED: uncharacterized protein LOC109350852 isoform X2 [Lupinus angustifolius]|uniref:uncharacterized protein LOC109350852 isoform X2 n=1 Tax=Lupinus angustifolius TaxID=3871 RepID=UPI00092E91A0|nr:PREDICTED: uncharacterized protein LOC109350852 isoform X2 [Lupinus angustifolius]
MAYRALKNWQMIVTEFRGGRRSMVTSTIPKMKPMSPTMDPAHDSHSTHRMSTLKADLAPVYIVCGMVVVAVSIGVHTAYQQLARSPAVHVNKKRRESVPEFSEPDHTIKSSNNFINGSFLRKLSHIQENKATLNDPLHPNPFTHPRPAETLKSVGIDPSKR